MATESEIGKPFYFSGKHVTDFIYEDEQCVVFEEDDKVSPEHFLVVPRKRIPRLCDASADDEKILGHLILVAKEVANQKRLHYAGYHVTVDENHITRRFNSLQVFGRALHHMVWPIMPGSRI